MYGRWEAEYESCGVRVYDAFDVLAFICGVPIGGVLVLRSSAIMGISRVPDRDGATSTSDLPCGALQNLIM